MEVPDVSKPLAVRFRDASGEPQPDRSRPPGPRDPARLNRALGTEPLTVLDETPGSLATLEPSTAVLDHDDELGPGPQKAHRDGGDHHDQEDESLATHPSARFRL